MTGFATLEQSYAQPENDTTAAVYNIRWDVKSVNAKGFDLRFRLPHGLDALEGQLRDQTKAVCTRGTIFANLTLDRANEASKLAINMAMVEQLSALHTEISKSVPLAPSTLEGILAMKGVLSDTQNSTGLLPVDEAEKAALMTAISSAFAQLLEQMIAARQIEGAKIAAFLGQQLEDMAAIVKKAADNEALTPEHIAERLKQQVATLIEAAPTLDHERLYAEAALLATKADIREEIDRLTLHIESAENILNQGGAAGRRLDFLSQELNREANTLCSKANAPSLTACGMELKVLIDQFREQVQNLE